MDNCIIAAQPADEYHADKRTPIPSLSKGTLHRLLTKTPAHARLHHPRLGGKKGKDSGIMDYGSAAHAMLLEGGASIVVVAADDWRTKVAKEAREAARAANKFPVLEHQYEKVATMAGVARKFLSDSFLGEILEDSTHEDSLYCQDSHGMWLRARTDIFSRDRTVIVDYKSTDIGSPGAWCRGMPTMGYDLQDVFYRHVARQITGIDPEFYFLVQETEEPYACYIVRCAPSLVAVAEHKMARGIKLWRECMQFDTWPAYEKTAYCAEAQAWAVMEEEMAS